MQPALFLVRHATPDWNRKDLVYHLPPGPPLTEQGKDEAQALAAFLSTEGIRLILSSPLERCLHTAQIVAESLHLPVQVIPALIEWQPGEEEEEVQRRLLPIVEQALETTQPACLVTHGGPISALLGAMGMPLDERKKLGVFDHNNLVPPAGVWKATRLTDDNHWSLDLVFKPVTNHQPK